MQLSRSSGLHLSCTNQVELCLVRFLIFSLVQALVALVQAHVDLVQALVALVQAHPPQGGKESG